jgi:hypothetical protein
MTVQLPQSVRDSFVASARERWVDVLADEHGWRFLDWTFSGPRWAHLR